VGLQSTKSILLWGDQAQSHPSSRMVRKYQNTIQNTYRVASAADASGSLQTALSKV